MRPTWTVDIRSTFTGKKKPATVMIRVRSGVGLRYCIFFFCCGRESATLIVQRTLAAFRLSYPASDESTRRIMADLKIRVFKGSDTTPETTVTVPGSVLKIASRLIPKRAADALQEKGIDLEEIIRLAENPDARGTLVEVEEHKNNERIVIALE